MPPSGDYTCSQQAAVGKCDADFVIAGGFCAATCGRCSGSSQGSQVGLVGKLCAALGSRSGIPVHTPASAASTLCCRGFAGSSHVRRCAAVKAQTSSITAVDLKPVTVCLDLITPLGCSERQQPV